MRHNILTPSVVLAAALALSGCFTSTADFQNEAEKFILEDEGLAEAVETTFSTADCEEPVDQNVETTFTCVAVDSEGDEWEFEIVILDSDEIEVYVSRFPTPSD
jgi:hypothetical protein